MNHPRKEEDNLSTIADKDKGVTPTISEHSSEQKAKVNDPAESVESYSDGDETEDEAEEIDAPSQIEAITNSQSQPQQAHSHPQSTPLETKGERSDKNDDQSIYAQFNASLPNLDGNMSGINSVAADLFSGKLAGTTASNNRSNQIELDMLRSMVQARAAASKAQGMMHPTAFNGSIDPDLLSKALALGNQTNQLGSQNNRSTFENQNQNCSIKQEDINPNTNAVEGNSDNLTAAQTQQSMAANLLDFQRSIGNQTSAMQALKDAAAGMQQSDVEMEEQQNILAASNGSHLTQGLSLPPALMNLLQNSAQEGQNASYMDTLQQIVKRQQQNLGDTSNTHPLPAVANSAVFPPSFPKDVISTNRPSPNLPATLAGPPLGNNNSDNVGDYRDYSKMCNNETNDFNKNQPPGKEPPFPVKLHRILSNPDFSDIISWLPHGRSWRVLKPKAFEEKVIPLYFRHAKYASFMRQVNGWGFKRMTHGPDHNSYYHELFLRGMQHLCYKMRRPTRARADADPDFNPDFYRLSIVAPLPNQDGNGLNGINGAVPNVPSVNGMNNTSIPSLPTNNILQNAGGLVSLAGMGNMNGLACMNMGMHGVDNALSSNLLQQQLQQNQNGGMGQFSGLSQGLQNGGNNLTGLQTGNIEQDQLEALRLRREELVLQLQRMVGNNTNSNIIGAGVQGMNSNHNGNGLMTSNAGNNAALLPNGLGSMGGNMGAMGSLLNQSLGSNPTAQLQQMMGVGGINGGTQSSMLSNSGAFGSNQTNGGLNMNSLSSNFSNGLSSNRSGHLGNNLNNFGAGLGAGGLAGLNQQLLMQNGMGGASGLAMNNNLGLGSMNNNMISQNLGAMLQANQFMGQQGNYGIPPDGNPYGDNNPSSSSV